LTLTIDQLSQRKYNIPKEKKEAQKEIESVLNDIVRCL